MQIEFNKIKPGMKVMISPKDSNGAIFVSVLQMKPSTRSLSCKDIFEDKVYEIKESDSFVYYKEGDPSYEKIFEVFAKCSYVDKKIKEGLTTNEKLKIYEALTKVN